MKKITMYELLGLVKDGKAPKKIKFNGLIWEYTEYQYQRIDKRDLGNMWNGYNFNILNCEVEILEEEPYVEVCGSWFTKSEYDKLFLEEEKKIPEKLTDILIVDDLVPPVNENMYKIWEQTIKNHNKINEICDYLKSKGE